MSYLPERSSATPRSPGAKPPAAAEASRDVAAPGPERLRAGTSLSQDAWCRLRRNRVAMASLGLLIVLSLLAFLTPLLPLQPPRRVDTARQFLKPQLWPLWQTFDRRLERGDAADAAGQAAHADQGAADAGDANQNQPAAPDDPFRQAFGELDPVSDLLLRVRMALLGRGSIASVCGTDRLGRDVLSRLFWGARVSLAVGLVATLVSLVIGVTYGAISGYFGGRLDNLMMRVVDVMYSVPFIFVVIFLITVLSEESIRRTLESRYGIDRMTVFFLLVGAIYWLTMARVVRGQVISLRNEPFVEAARAMGASQARIIAVHIVPNLLSVVIVYLTLTIPRVMLFEAFLSFLGLGVEPPDVSWGLLANDGMQAITPVRIYWWLVVFPGLALGLTLLALNFLGDGLRDALDPRLKDR